MKLQKLQIVSFDNPYPPNYGGVIDVFYKIKYLHRLNIEIDLHIFYDDRLDLSQLEPLCKAIYLYKRNKSAIKLFAKIPFRVASRASKQMYENLSQNDAPILFEGLQSTQVLLHNTFKNKIIIRTHNIEHSYCYGLAKNETNIFLKGIYFLEGFKFKKYEKILNKANIIITLSRIEHEYFKSNYDTQVVFVPVFHGNETISNLNSTGKFALYHGDLTTADNIKSVRFLISVFANLNYPLIIAGSVISKSMEKLINNYDMIQFQKLEENDAILNELFKKAHANILHSNQQSGTKLKVFNSLFKGRYCIVNKNITDDEDVLSLCEVVATKEDYIEAIKKVFQKNYHLTKDRETILDNYKPIKLASKLINAISK